MLRDVNAEYNFGPKKVKIIPLDYEMTTPLPLTGAPLTSLIRFGGPGPYDFSGVDDPAAVELTIKLDNGTPETHNIDVSGAVSVAAVTAAELANAIDLAGFADMDAAVDARGYLSIEYTPALTNITTERYLQVYGECAEIAGFGQGFGSRFLYLDTIQTVNISPTYKDSETIGQSDVNGKDQELLTDQYRKGFTGTISDTARDPAVRQIVEGGVYDEDYDTYTPPNSQSPVIYFAIEVARKIYRRGTNKEGDNIGWLLQRYYTAMGKYGDDAGDRNFQIHGFPIIGTEYTDPCTEETYSDMMDQEFTNAEWEIFDWDNI
jgi:hypothetical protein